MKREPPAIDRHRVGRLSVEEASRLLPLPATPKWPLGEFDISVFDRRDGAGVLYFGPRETDYQTPHDRDEFYVVVSGAGVFLAGNEEIRYAPGDLLYVPRGVAHHFVEPPADLRLWVFFLPNEIGLQGR